MIDKILLSRRHKRSQGWAAPNRNATMIKMWQKSLLVLQFCFLSALSRTTYTLTTAINKNIDDQGARNPSIRFLSTNLYL